MKCSSRVAILSLATLSLGACASDPSQDNLMATLPIAASCGNAHHLATWMIKDLDAATSIPEEEKAMLRARGEVLRAHAEKLSAAVDLYDPAGKQNPSITLANLRARAKALEAEHRITFNEWGIWQVRHGLRKPEDVSLLFEFDEAME